MNGACNGIFLPRPLGEGRKVKYRLISVTMSFSKIFIPNFVCVLKDKHTRRNFHSVAWAILQGWDFGALGCPGGPKIMSFKHGHVAYQIDGDDEQNRMQVKFSS